jgi:predicted transcriptional regulator of viral defense system
MTSGVRSRRTALPSHRRFLASRSGGIVTNMAGEPVDSNDSSVMDRLYEIAESQGGFLAAHQAVAAGIPRSTLSYHATEGDALERVGHGVYRMRRFPAPPHGHVIAGWLALARADGVVSHESALELLDLSDLIADEVHVTLPRAKRGLRTPPGVHIHFTDRLIDHRARRLVLGIPMTGVERTVADMLRSGGWTEQTDLAVRHAIRRGLTTRQRLEAELPAKWRSRLDGAIDLDAT